ncbi:hypothetical protein HOK51_03415 [Candidatus Woesearchaeota archaeon]|jgi:hypothetical protein|nr:hypothetical protein [Candidatus Woesearchaeota archaeon]MBT6518869.1 hypothetical protein [Candidatus Woesearchaeota archaeon]MBT7368008.1 hypothetical protein [Candidatus Woesearchaeota archaeon]
MKDNKKAIYSEKIIDLKIKKFEMELEKDKDIHKFLFAFIAGIATFLVTSGFVANSINDLIRSWVLHAVELQNIWTVIILLLVLFLPGIIAAFLTRGILEIFIKSRSELYTKKIDKINKLIREIKNY